MCWRIIPKISKGRHGLQGGNQQQQFDPFGISDTPKATGQEAQAGSELPPVKFDAFEDEFDEDATTPLASGSGKPANKLAKVNHVQKQLCARPVRAMHPPPAWHIHAYATFLKPLRSTASLHRVARTICCEGCIQSGTVQACPICFAGAIQEQGSLAQLASPHLKRTNTS